MSAKTLAQAFPALVRLCGDSMFNRLQSLARRPPQVLLFEGGNEEARLELARYWACVNLCASAERPCLTCVSCRSILQDQCVEIRALDGRISSKEDEDNPGFFRTFNAENARDLKHWLGNFPKLRYHLVYITGIAASRPEAPNALLKILEEPSSSALFVLLVPQREQILPTLVSRSLTLTLPYVQRDEALSEDVDDLLQRFAAFLIGREDFLGYISPKSFLNLQLARDFLLGCQNSLVHTLADEAKTPLEGCLKNLSVQALSLAILWTQEACAMLRNDLSPVSPLRVLEAYAMRLYLLGRS